MTLLYRKHLMYFPFSKVSKIVKSLIIFLKMQHFKKSRKLMWNFLEKGPPSIDKLDRTQHWSNDGMPPPAGWLSIPSSQTGLQKPLQCASDSVMTPKLYSIPYLVMLWPQLLICKFCPYSLMWWPWPLTLKFSEIFNTAPISRFEWQRFLSGIFEWSCCSKTVFLPTFSVVTLTVDLWTLNYQKCLTLP